MGEHFCCEDLLPGECLDCVGRPRPFVVIDGDRVAVEVLGEHRGSVVPGLGGSVLRVRLVDACPGLDVGTVRYVRPWDVIRPVGEPVTKRPVPLTDPSGNARAWACGACGLIAYDEGGAARCCVCTRCGHQLSRDRRVGTEHSDCNAARWAGITASERQRYVFLHGAPLVSHGEAVKQLTEREYAGPVYWSDRGPQEGYFEDIGDLRAWADGEGEALPAWVFACHVRPFALDADEILDAALADRHEGARDALDSQGVTDLQTLLDGWVESAGVPDSWDQDCTRIVVLDREVTP